MMRIRSIYAGELARFAWFSDDPTEAAVRSMEELAQKLWAEGRSRPEWFFLAERGGEPVGRVAYWRLKARPEEMRLIALKLPWEGDYVDVGLPLLLESGERLRSSGAHYVLRQLVSFWDYLDEQREVLELAGMALLQEKQAYLWKASEPVAPPQRLNYRPVQEAGEAAFVEAIRRVTTGVVDREIQAMGADEAARQLFAILKEDTGFNPAWSQLAYTANGDLVGLVAPVGMLDSEDEASIGYIGVVPEQRGRGYIDDLLAKGMAVLHQAGFKEVYSETDRENAAMRRAFERAGHRPYCRVWLYRGRM